MELINGDSLYILNSIAENKIDALVTDPPAGISFMGKGWDNDKGGRDQWIKWLSEVMRECLRVMKPGAHGLVWALPRTSHWTATALEDSGFEIRDVVTHLFGSGFPKSLDISKAIDKAAGVEREIIDSVDVGPDIRGDNFKRDNGERMIANITIPKTDAAKQWEGWGTALKPASEHWILIRKPISEKTVAANVLRWCVGGLNIDGSRVPGKLEGDQNRFSKAYSMGDGHEGWKRNAHENYVRPVVRTEGRFPANLVLSHSEHCLEDQCDIECAIKMLDEQSGPCKTGALTGQPRVENKTYGRAGSTLGTPRFYSPDAASGASRFFYCAKASKSDKGGDNSHPTVKSTKLMAYLIKLITPHGGVVLDPFMGSGSTGVSAVNGGFDFVGIEKEAEYFEIAKKRLEAING